MVKWSEHKDYPHYSGTVGHQNTKGREWWGTYFFITSKSWYLQLDWIFFSTKWFLVTKCQFINTQSFYGKYMPFRQERFLGVYCGISDQKEIEPEPVVTWLLCTSPRMWENEIQVPVWIISQCRLGPELSMSQRNDLNYWTCSYSDYVFFWFSCGKNTKKKFERSWFWLSVECEFCNFKNFPGRGKLISTQFTSHCVYSFAIRWKVTAILT